MKVLAVRSFKNPGRQLEIPNAQHPDHVHKGAIFNIGTADNFKSLSPAEKHILTELNQARCLGEPTPENIAKVQAELAVEKAHAGRDKLMHTAYVPK